MSVRSTKLKTLRRFLIEDAVYFVTATTRKREPFFNAEFAPAAVGALQSLRGRGKILLLAYVFMPEHVHLVVKPMGGLTVSTFMAQFKWLSGKPIRTATGRSRVWEHRFFDRVIRSERELLAAIKYVEENPVKAGLCNSPEDYPYSSAHPSALTDLDRFTTASEEA